MRKVKIIDCIEIMKHWDYKRNSAAGYDVNNMFISSTKKAFFMCEKGHEYTARINSKASKHTGCPICSNKLIIKGINDFGSNNEELLLRWDFEKNIDVSPFEISEGSNKLVYWKCEKGHSFESKVYRMVMSKKGLNCPYCRNQKVLKGYNDLLTTNLNLAKEWNYERNIGVLPEEVIAGSPKKYWWKCGNGHEWEASLSSRNSGGYGCPYCAGQKAIVGKNDLKSTHPELICKWDTEKNKDTAMTDYMPQSNKSVWWKCEKGHSFKSSIYHMTAGRGCPYCSNKKVLIGYNDLLTTDKKVANEWNYNKNKKIDIYSVTKGSSKKVWWICNKGHEWEATIASRTNGTRCPYCSLEFRASLPEKTFFYYIKNIFPDACENKRIRNDSQMELDIYIPSIRVGIEYDGEVWHQNVENDLKKDKICLEEDIALYRIRENKCPDYISNSIKINCENPHDNIYRLEDTIKTLFIQIEKRFNISIDCSIDVKKDYDEILKTFVNNKKSNSLAELSPLHAQQWNYEKNDGISPFMVANKSQKYYWWKCKKGHEWKARVSDKVRSKSVNCPFCKKEL